MSRTERFVEQFDRFLFIVVGAIMAGLLLFPAVAAPQERATADAARGQRRLPRPETYEGIEHNYCHIREEGIRAGQMRAFHIYLILEYEDGTSWARQEAILPINYEPTDNTHLKQSIRKEKALDKAWDICRAWRRELASEQDKLDQKQLARNHP